MPTRKMNRTAKDMKIGEEAFTSPWGLRFYSDDRNMVWANIPIYDEPQKLSTVKIKRTQTGFVVDISDAEYTWEILDPDELVVIDVINTEEENEDCS